MAYVVGLCSRANAFVFVKPHAVHCTHARKVDFLSFAVMWMIRSSTQGSKVEPSYFDYALSIPLSSTTVNSVGSLLAALTSLRHEDQSCAVVSVQPPPI